MCVLIKRYICTRLFLLCQIQGCATIDPSTSKISKIKNYSKNISTKIIKQAFPKNHVLIIIVKHTSCLWLCILISTKVMPPKPPILEGHLQLIQFCTTKFLLLLILLLKCWRILYSTKIILLKVIPLEFLHFTLYSLLLFRLGPYLFHIFIKLHCIHF